LWKVENFHDRNKGKLLRMGIKEIFQIRNNSQDRTKRKLYRLRIKENFAKVKSKFNVRKKQ
jgi:hypothetical protein